MSRENINKPHKTHIDYVRSYPWALVKINATRILEANED